MLSSSAAPPGRSLSRHLGLRAPRACARAAVLALIARRAERRQITVEILGAGVLALAAPAGYWVGIGRPDVLGWWLLALVWAQSASSIVYAYLRLAQRTAAGPLSRGRRLRMGESALAFALVNLAFVSALCLAHVLPAWLFVAYGVQAAETIYGTLVPATGWMPRRIGMRQLVVSILFTAAFSVAWRLHV